MGQVSTVRFRLFPVLIVGLFVAFGMKVLDISSDLDVFVSPALAQESDSQENDADTEANTGKANQSDDEDEAPGAGSPNSSVHSADSIARQLLKSQTLGLPGQEELQLISELKSRREELDRRERQIVLQQQVLAGAEVRLDEKRQALIVLEEQIKSHLRIFDERESAQLKTVVEVYQRMDPKDAAPRFEALGDKIQMDLAALMDNKKFAALLAEMTPAKATNLTLLLATRAEPPSLEDLQAN